MASRGRSGAWKTKRIVSPEIVPLLVHDLCVVLSEAGASDWARAMTGARLLMTASAVLWRLAV